MPTSAKASFNTSDSQVATPDTVPTGRPEGPHQEVIGAPGPRHGRGELGHAEHGGHGDHAGQGVGQHRTRSGLGRGQTGQQEQARAQHRAGAQHEDVTKPQRAGQATARPACAALVHVRLAGRAIPKPIPARSSHSTTSSHHPAPVTQPPPATTQPQSPNHLQPPPSPSHPTTSSHHPAPQSPTHWTGRARRAALRQQPTTTATPVTRSPRLAFWRELVAVGVGRDRRRAHRHDPPRRRAEAPRDPAQLPGDRPPALPAGIIRPRAAPVHRERQRRGAALQPQPAPLGVRHRQAREPVLRVRLRQPPRRRRLRLLPALGLPSELRRPPRRAAGRQGAGSLAQPSRGLPAAVGGEHFRNVLRLAVGTCGGGPQPGIGHGRMHAQHRRGRHQRLPPPRCRPGVPAGHGFTSAPGPRTGASVWTPSWPASTLPPSRRWS